MATGSEVSLIVEAGKRLAEQGTAVRLVSFPSWELFAEQDREYRDSVLLPDVKLRLAVEAGITMGWCRWVGDNGRVIGLDHYGASAPGKTVFEQFGFTTANVEKIAKEMLGK